MDKNFKNGMTLDSRTFEKCSNAMLMHFSSTLQTKDELIHTPLGQFEIRSKPGQNQVMYVNKTINSKVKSLLKLKLSPFRRIIRRQDSVEFHQHH